MLPRKISFKKEELDKAHSRILLKLHFHCPFKLLNQTFRIIANVFLIDVVSHDAFDLCSDGWRLDFRYKHLSYAVAELHDLLIAYAVRFHSRSRQKEYQ